METLRSQRQLKLDMRVIIRHVTIRLHEPVARDEPLREEQTGDLLDRATRAADWGEYSAR